MSEVVHIKVQWDGGCSVVHLPSVGLKLQVMFTQIGTKWVK